MKHKSLVEFKKEEANNVKNYMYIQIINLQR